MCLVFPARVECWINGNMLSYFWFLNVFDTMFLYEIFHRSEVLDEVCISISSTVELALGVSASIGATPSSFEAQTNCL